MATMRHDRTSLWGDPRISATEILESLQQEEQRANLARTGRASPFAFAGVTFVAALGLKLIGFDRAAKLLAWLVPPMLMLGMYEQMSHHAPRESSSSRANL